MAEANAVQIGGTHYKGSGYETWDFISDMGLDYFTGNAVKYLSRHKAKGGKVDLEKARHYIEKKLELLEAKPQEPSKHQNRVGYLLRYFEAHQFDDQTTLTIILVSLTGIDGWVEKLRLCCQMLTVMIDNYGNYSDRLV